MKKKTVFRTLIFIAVGCVLAVIIATAFLVIVKIGPRAGMWLFPPTPQKYADFALSLMDKEGYYSQGEEWASAKAAAELEFENVASYEDSYETLAKLAKIAGGKHSFFKAPSNAQDTSSAAQTAEIAFPEIKKEQDVLIIKLPEFEMNPMYDKKYSEIVLTALKANQMPKGVIIDLRGNRGGDMNPMILAVSPLIPDGEILYWGTKTRKIPVTLQGFILSTSTIVIEMEPFKLPDSTPIAILTDNLTASSGEATLLVFRGLPNVKVFGAPTAGYASCNSSYSMYDGAMLALTIGSDIARTGESFCEDPIAPDIETENPYEDAIEWVNGMAQ